MLPLEDAGAEQPAADLFAELGAEPGRVKSELFASVGAHRREQSAEAPDVGVVADLIPGPVEIEREALLYRRGQSIRHLAFP